MTRLGGLSAFACALLGLAACSRDWAFLDDAASDAGTAPATASVADAASPGDATCGGACAPSPPSASSPDASSADASSADASSADASSADAAAPDAADAGFHDGVTCDPLAKFDAPKLVDGIGTELDEESAVLTPNELVIYFARGTHGASFDIYSATRLSLDAAFGDVQKVDGASTDAEDVAAMPTSDGLAMLVDSYASGRRHLMLAARASTDAGFGAPVLIPSLASGNEDGMPFVLGRGEVVYFSSSRLTSHFDVYRAELADGGDGGDYTWASVPGINGPTTFEGYPVVTSDERGMYFGAAAVPDSYATDIYFAQRAEAGAAFEARALVPELDADAYHNYPSWLSADGCRLYLTSSRAGGHGAATGSPDDTKDVWVAVRHP